MSIFKMPLGVGLITLTSFVAADLDMLELYNGQGQTPCCVTQQLIAHCQASISRDCGNPIQVTDINLGSMCTCNTVVFNLWSGCLVIRNATMLYFNTWATSCQVNMTSVTYNDFPLHDVAKDVEIPTWAYISLAQDSSFDLAAALDKARGWTTAQVLIPIILCVSAIGGLGALYFWYRRRMYKKLEGGQAESSTWREALRGSRRPLGASTQVRSNSRYRKSWAIDDFVTARGQSIDSEDDQHGYVWLTPAPSSPDETITQKLQRYIQPSTDLWRNPFKNRPIKVVSLPPRRGFRVDDADVNTNAGNSRRPTLDTDNVIGNGAARETMTDWSSVHSEEIFDARDDVLDERSVLLISRAPGVDFTVASPTTQTNITPTSQSNNVESSRPPESIPLSSSHTAQAPRHPHSQSIGSYHNPSLENILRPPKTDPTMLFPASVRAAGYTGVPTQHFSHSRTSSGSMLYDAALTSQYTNHR